MTTISELARKMGVSTTTVMYWVSYLNIDTRRSDGKRLVLSDDDAEQIKQNSALYQKRQGKHEVTEIAQRLGVTRAYIFKICKALGYRKGGGRRIMLDDEQVKEIGSHVKRKRDH